jgi:hypothetical protein
MARRLHFNDLAAAKRNSFKTEYPSEAPLLLNLLDHLTRNCPEDGVRNDALLHGWYIAKSFHFGGGRDLICMVTYDFDSASVMWKNFSFTTP